MFRGSIDELRNQIRLLIETKADATVRLSVLSDQSRRQVIALVLMPREAFSAEVRSGFRTCSRTVSRASCSTIISRSAKDYTARLHFCFYAQPPSAALVRKVEAEIAALARTWDDRLRELFGQKFGPTRAHEMLARWGLAFAPEYKAVFDVDRAAADAEHIERLLCRWWI